jgi:hypothetical protein
VRYPRVSWNVIKEAKEAEGETRGESNLVSQFPF